MKGTTWKTFFLPRVSSLKATRDEGRTTKKQKTTTTVPVLK